MAEWDITTISLVLVGCRIIAAGIIIAIVLLGYLHTFAPFLLLTAIILVVMGAVAILFVDQKSRKTA